MEPTMHLDRRYLPLTAVLIWLSCTVIAFLIHQVFLIWLGLILLTGAGVLDCFILDGFQKSEDPPKGFRYTREHRVLVATGNNQPIDLAFSVKESRYKEKEDLEFYPEDLEDGI